MTHKEHFLSLLTESMRDAELPVLRALMAADGTPECVIYEWMRVPCVAELLDVGDGFATVSYSETSATDPWWIYACALPHHPGTAPTPASLVGQRWHQLSMAMRRPEDDQVDFVQLVWPVDGWQVSCDSSASAQADAEGKR